MYDVASVHVYAWKRLSPSKDRGFVCLLFFFQLDSSMLHHTNRVHLLFLRSDAIVVTLVSDFFFSILILADLYLFVFIFYLFLFINNVLLIIEKKTRSRTISEPRH